MVQNLDAFGKTRPSRGATNCANAMTDYGSTTQRPWGSYPDEKQPSLDAVEIEQGRERLCDARQWAIEAASILEAKVVVTSDVLATLTDLSARAELLLRVARLHNDRIAHSVFLIEPSAAFGAVESRTTSEA